MRELRDQPALADARIAGDDEQSRPPVDGVVPGLEDLIKFSLAPHEPGTLSKPRTSMSWAART